MPVRRRAGCGYVGEPLPPALNLPNKVADLRATGRGGRIVLNFTIPAETTENLPLTRITGVELRLWPVDGKPFDLERFGAASQLIPVVAEKPGEVTVETPAAAWVGRELVFAVRTFGPRRRPSDWSNLALITVLAPLAGAGDIVPEAVPEGV
ncbi:MAG: hypothetical protein NTY38_26810, partial [Acidobacteria bacterium]|nr:hypothetical protein [Acidobacteriota bacterium]